MTRLRYTLLVEGIIENYFLPRLLEKIASQYGKQLVRSSLSIKISAQPSKTKVYDNIEEFAATSLINQEEHLFIVGVDLDEPDHEDNKAKKEHKNLEKRLPKNVDDKQVIIFVAVQAMDYWVLYQKHQVDGSKSPAANSLESKTKDEVKKELYGKSSPDKRTTQQIAQKILDKIDIAELCKQSKSFKKFHGQVINFLNPK